MKKQLILKLIGSNQFVTKDIAIKLQSLGFDEPCFAGYDISVKENSLFYNEICYPSAQDSTSTIFPRMYKKTCHQNKHIIKAPTWDAIIEWFVEKGYYIHLGPELYADGVNWCWQILWYYPKDKWTEYLVNDGTYYYGDNHEFPTRKDAIKAAIYKIIEIITK